MNHIKTKPFCASSLNLAHMLTMINPIDFGGHSSQVNVTMGIIDKCGVHGDATLCVVIFGLNSSKIERSGHAGFVLFTFFGKNLITDNILIKLTLHVI